MKMIGAGTLAFAFPQIPFSPLTAVWGDDGRVIRFTLGLLDLV
jgi:hypothetical protein